MLHIAALVVGLLAASASTTDDEKGADALLCQGGAMSIYLPDREGKPAPNISLVQFQYRSDNDPCGRNIGNEELMRLHRAIRSVTASVFATSTKSFWVMAKYALTPDGPATLEMKASIPQTGNEELGTYYDKAATLTDFHSTKGVVEVLFHYEVSPSSPKHKAPDRNGG